MMKSMKGCKREIKALVNVQSKEVSANIDLLTDLSVSLPCLLMPVCCLVCQDQLNCILPLGGYSIERHSYIRMDWFELYALESSGI